MPTEILLFVLCLLSFDFYSKIEPIFYLPVLILFLLSDFTPKKWGVWCCIIYIGLALWNPMYLAFIPLLLYELYSQYQIYALVALSLIPFTPTNKWTLLALSALALYLAYLESRYKVSLEQLKHQFDDLREQFLHKEYTLQQYSHEQSQKIEIAILNERNRIAREIHDSVGHALSSCILQTEVLKIEEKNEQQLQKLDLLQQTLKNGMQDIRHSLHNLHDSSLDLKNSMQNILDTVPLQNSFNYAVNSDMAYSMKIGVLSVFKEMLANVAKHSDATKVDIRLIEHKNYYSFSIKDNGQPKSTSYTLTNFGMGLQSIEEFSKKYGGQLSYGYDKGGFLVHITLQKHESGIESEHKQ